MWLGKYGFGRGPEVGADPHFDYAEVTHPAFVHLHRHLLPSALVAEGHNVCGWNRDQGRQVLAGQHNRGARTVEGAGLREAAWQGSHQRTTKEDWKLKSLAHS